MGEIKFPPDVLLLVSILYSQDKMLDNAVKALEKEFGNGILLDYKGIFNKSDYYNDELGIPIYRRFWRADKLFKRDMLDNVKIRTNKIETVFSEQNKRKFNLDPGFLSAENFILATTKNYTHRIYLKNGIYADLTLIFREKEFKPLDWTYPDYAEREIRELLRREREEYLRRLRG
ncbi:MAG: DUF4416 family protein [Deltaproteobacteria bacterium]|nr:DUF4416 family protein [Deltaproteobacteria bacterium]